MRYLEYKNLREMRFLCKNICIYRKKAVPLHQQTYPASRKISALRVSLFCIFPARLKALLAEFPDVDPSAMGFPANWELEHIWLS